MSRAEARAHIRRAYNYDPSPDEVRAYIIGQAEERAYFEGLIEREYVRKGRHLRQSEPELEFAQ
jgi:hypothetical protein